MAGAAIYALVDGFEARSHRVICGSLIKRAVGGRGRITTGAQDLMSELARNCLQMALSFDSSFKALISTGRT